MNIIIIKIVTMYQCTIVPCTIIVIVYQSQWSSETPLFIKGGAIYKSIDLPNIYHNKIWWWTLSSLSASAIMERTKRLEVSHKEGICQTWVLLLLHPLFPTVQYFFTQLSTFPHCPILFHSIVHFGVECYIYTQLNFSALPLYSFYYPLCTPFTIHCAHVHFSVECYFSTQTNL